MPRDEGKEEGGEGTFADHESIKATMIPQREGLEGHVGALEEDYFEDRSVV